MPRRLYDRAQERRELQRLYSTRTNTRLKYYALGAIAVSVAAMIFIIFRLDSLSRDMVYLLRGCAGLFALIFVVLVTVLVYRVYSAYWQQRNGAHKRD